MGCRVEKVGPEDEAVSHHLSIGIFYAILFVATASICFVLTWAMILLSKRIGCVDLPDKIKKHPMPGWFK